MSMVTRELKRKETEVILDEQGIEVILDGQASAHDEGCQWFLVKWKGWPLSSCV